MVSRRQLLGLTGAAAATGFTGCLHGGLSVEASKDALELPRDSLEVTLRNSGSSTVIGPGSRSISKVVDGEPHTLAPVQYTAEGLELASSDDYTWTFSVDNTDPSLAPPHPSGGLSLWGLDSGRYIFDTHEDGLSVEFDVEGEPVDDEPTADDVEHDDDVVRLYTEGYRAVEDDAEEPRAKFTVEPVEDAGEEVGEILTEQLNQLRPIRDGFLHSDGGEVEVYVGEGEPYYLDSYLRLYTGERAGHDDGTMFEYRGSVHRVRSETWAPTEEESS